MDYKITVSLAEVEVETLGDITRPIHLAKHWLTDVKRRRSTHLPTH